LNGVRAGCAAGMMVFGFVDLTPAEKLAGAGAAATFEHMRELPALLA
jgi:beta-phosphoglucomutase-like phosphatase (HAD superfamily)